MQDVFNNRYKIVKSIGTGGMAEVYQARDLTLDCTVAIKVMKSQLTSDDYFVRQFKNEARAAAGLTSPHVVGIRDWVQDENGYYIVMEYVRGIDLKHVLAKHGAINPAKIAEIASQVCLALQEAHARSIVHCDIKTANIMLQASGDIKVMDFGIAQSKRHSSPDDTGQPIVGTVSYMSPEQIRGAEATPLNDIYSLGIVMYELATARMPFIGDNIKDVARKQLEEDPVAPMELNQALDADLNAIILKAMAKSPDVRYQSAAAMRADLEAYLATDDHAPNELDFPAFWAVAVTKGDEDLRGKIFKIEESSVIGRNETCDVQIPDSTVSGRHLQATPCGLYLDIEDLGSSNGTFVDGLRIHCKTLCKAGSNIDLGNVRIRIGKKSAN